MTSICAKLRDVDIPAKSTPRTLREYKLTSGVDFENWCGLEVGALHRPIFRKEWANVYYLDHCSTEGLKRKYKHINPNEMVGVDFVDDGRELSEIVNGMQFDYILASHVFEHIGNPIGWLRRMATVLKNGGVLILAIPDKRFIFDALRPVSTVSQWIENFLEDRQKPRPRDVFEFARYSFMKKDDVNVPLTLWKGAESDQSLWGRHPIQYAFQQAQRSLDEYVDVHAGVYTPESFLSNLRDTLELDLVPYMLKEFFDVQPYDIEFIAHLWKSEKTDRTTRMKTIDDVLVRVACKGQAC